MKHSLKVTILLVIMFFITQLLGLSVVGTYSPQVKQLVTENGTIVNETTYNLPYWTNPPTGITPQSALVSIIIAIFFAVAIMLILMKYQVEFILRLWFFLVISLALGITINSFLINVQYSSIISLLIAVPLSFTKIFKRGMITHNVTELLIYPGIAAIFVPLLSVTSAFLLLVLISIYDIYAVWQAGFMQKMAQYQIKTLKLFSGFFVPYIGQKEREALMCKDKAKRKKVKVSMAILGGGDVVFPIIFAGVVLNALGFLSALCISIGATIALAGLFYLSEKGKFYPAMPFISAGCFLAYALVHFIL